MENIKNCEFFSSCNHIDCSENFCLKKYKLDFLFEQSLLSPVQRKSIPLFIDSNGTDKAEYTEVMNIIANIVDFVKAGKNLYLFSANCGVGKSTLAAKAIVAYLNKIWPQATLDCHALFISVPDFLLALKDNITRPSKYIAFIKDNILKADLVVWDDIGAKETATEFELNQLLSTIDKRIALGKSNIYTSNLNATKIFAIFGDRFASRVYNFSQVIEFKGKDKRAISALK